MDKEFNYPRDFKGVWIPKQVFLDERLNAIEKLILAEVDSLDVEGSEGCFASNEYLANFCQCSVTKVSTSVSKLIKFGYLYVLKNDGRKRYLKSRLSNFESQEFKNSNSDTPNMKQSNNNYKYSVDDTDKDCTLSSTEEKTLPLSGKGVKTSAPNNNINININNIPPRTKEQKQERCAHVKKNRSVDYKDEELPTILYNGFNSLYGDKEDILEDHDICLTMALVSKFFEKYKQYRGERHPMVYANDLDQFLSMIRNADLDMVKDGIVEEDEEPQYYLDMMDEYFGSDIGKNNNMDCDYHIWLFFTERTQNILYNRVKQNRNE